MSDICVIILAVVGLAVIFLMLHAVFVGWQIEAMFDSWRDDRK